VWNPFRTFRESDSKRLRRLEILVDELGGDVALAQERLVKLDARLRARARRAIDATDDSDVPEQPGKPELVPPTKSVYSKDELRQMARAKGIRV